MARPFYGISMVDKLVEPGKELIGASSTYNNARIHAAVKADGSVAIMVLNTHLAETANVTAEHRRHDARVGRHSLHPYRRHDDVRQHGRRGLGNSFLAGVAPRSIATHIIPATAPEPRLAALIAAMLLPLPRRHAIAVRRKNGG